MKTSTAALLSALILQLMLASGCVTQAVWEDGPLARYREPAPSPNLEIFCAKDKRDFLIEYDEAREGGSSPKRHAYWVLANEHRLEERKKPKFVSLERVKDLESIPLRERNLSQLPATNDSGANWYAVLSTNNLTFTVYSGEDEVLIQDMPVYQDWSGRTKQVLLTPPAVIADATVVGGLITYFCLPAVWPALSNFSH